MMEQQRVFIWAAVLSLALLIWNTWQAEHPIQTLPADASSSIPLSVSTDKVVTTTNTTLPNALLSAPEEKKSAIIREQNIVHVDTNVLSVDIDLQGGELVGLRLPMYPLSLEHKKDPVELLNNNAATRYIAESRWVTKTDNEKLLYQAEKTIYNLGDKPTLQVKLTTQQKGLFIEKIYVFQRDSYLMQVQYHLKNTRNSAVEGYFLANFLRKKPIEKTSMVYQTYTGAAISSPEKSYQKVTFKDLTQQDLDKTIVGGWAAMLQHYFVTAWIPQNKTPYHYYSKSLGNDEFAIGWFSPAMQVPANGALQWESQFYAGPAKADLLKAAAPHLDLTIDYGMFWIFSVFIFAMMKHIFHVVGNWGWSIVLVTLTIKLLFYQLSASSYRSMAKMREITPKLQALKERYSDDRQRLTQETMALYKEAKVNPLGGCLPVLVQFPVFIGLYWALVETVELRQSPFILWIHDLSLKDPFYVLPVLMGLSMLWQQRLSPPPPDPMQAKVMMLMPVIFTVFFLNFPTGLVLYWLVNNVLSVLQQSWINYSLAPKTLKSPKIKNATKSSTP